MKFLVNLVIILLVIPVNIKKIVIFLINSFKNFSDDEIYAELKRRKANKSAK